MVPIPECFAQPYTFLGGTKLQIKICTVTYQKFLARARKTSYMHTLLEDTGFPIIGELRTTMPDQSD